MAIRARNILTFILLALVASAARASGSSSQFLSAPSTVNVTCAATTVSLPVTWYFPEARSPAGLVWLQHGFIRANQNVAGLASSLARAGVVVVTPTIDSLQSACTFNHTTDFIPNLAALFSDVRSSHSPLVASARAAADSLGMPFRPLPQRFVFAGHSAGGAAVTLAAKEFVSRFPSISARLKGLILLDPVESFAGSLRASLSTLAELPILTVSAPPSPCNANTSGTRALLDLARPFIGLELATGSHCDAEGFSGNPVLCGVICGRVRLTNVITLQAFAVGWTTDLLLTRTRPGLYPGGDLYDALVTAGVIRTH